MAVTSSAPPTRLLRLWLPRARATAALATAAASEARSGDTLLLHGAVGAGKSEFARHYVREAIGDAHISVPSPTFLLQQSYDLHGSLMLHHFDLYRIEDTLSLARLQMRERFCDSVCLVEWPEIIPKEDLPIERLDVRLEIHETSDIPDCVKDDMKAIDEEYGDEEDDLGSDFQDKQCRTVELEGHGIRWSAFCDALAGTILKLEEADRIEFGGIRLIET